SLLRIILAATLGLSSVVNGQAQIRLDIDSLIDAKIGEIDGLTLSMSNETSENFNGNIRITGTPGVRILGDTERMIPLSAVGKRFIPIQVRIDPEASPEDAFVMIAVRNNDREIVAEIS